MSKPDFSIIRHHLAAASYPGYLPAAGSRDLDTLMRILHAKDDYTARHCHQVMDLSVALGMHLELTSAELGRTALAALYHDVGKVGITRNVLNKDGPLDCHEWRAIRTHPVIGHELVASLFPHNRIAEVVRQHHESWDGEGYPDGLCGEEILLEAQILRLCDVYDALVSDRPYRDAYTPSRARTIIERGIGTDFQPTVASEFIKLTEKFQRAA